MVWDESFSARGHIRLELTSSPTPARMRIARFLLFWNFLSFRFCTMVDNGSHLGVTSRRHVWRLLRHLLFSATLLTPRCGCWIGRRGQTLWEAITGSEKVIRWPSPCLLWISSVYLSSSIRCPVKRRPILKVLQHFFLSAVLFILLF